MSAVTPKETKLRLPPSKGMPRELVIGWTFYGEHSFHASCHAFIGPERAISAAYGGAHAVSDTRLSYEPERAKLWFGFAQFDLTAPEAAEVERVLAPLGLAIVREQS